MTTTSTRTIATILGAGAAAVTLALALAPAWVPAQANDALRVVELPRVVITGQRERAAVVELPRVVISARRASQPAGHPVAANGAQPVLQRVPN